jgi:hypothetical protein
MVKMGEAPQLMVSLAELDGEPALEAPVGFPRFGIPGGDQIVVVAGV